MMSQQFQTTTSVYSIDVPPPVVWVEAEQLFIARGYLYKVTCAQIEATLNAPPADLAYVGRSAPERSKTQYDCDFVLAHDDPHHFVALSSRTPTQVKTELPPGWTQALPLIGLTRGTLIGSTIVVRVHGQNEYTVILPPSEGLVDSSY